MRIWEALQIPGGITAVIGSGGKTTLLEVLARELPGRVILYTTTRMLPPAVCPMLYDPSLEQLRAETDRVFCVGSRAEKGKIGPCGTVTAGQLAEAADYVLVEADGSRRLPLKAHAPWEPVIPPGTARVVCVVGASGFGRPIEQSVHRPQLWRSPDTSPEGVAGMLLMEGGWDVVLVNQCDTPSQMAQAKRLAAVLEDRRVCAGSLQKGEIQCLL